MQGTKAPRYIAPVDALPASHWNQRELEGPWINTQDGRLMRPKVIAGHVETGLRMSPYAQRRARGCPGALQRTVVIGTGLVSDRRVSATGKGLVLNV